MSIEPDLAQIRVLGCLIEKQRTTPDQYPLSVNALRLACNQSTNRDPVMDLDERTVLDSLEQLSRRGWTRLASGAGSRARKYRHLLDRELPASEAELAVLCVLMLRGPQTPGELNQRTERMHRFDPATLDGLVERGLVRRLERRPGQKEQRCEQLLGGAPDEQDGAPAAAPVVTVSPRPAAEIDRIAALEAEMGRLRGDVDALKRELGL